MYSCLQLWKKAKIWISIMVSIPHSPSDSHCQYDSVEY